MLKIASTFALIVALVILIASFDPPAKRADFVVVNNGDVSTLDFTQMSWVQDFRAARLLYEGLTRSDVFRQSYPTLPAGAESWEISDDHRTYTFHIRPDARWSNGDPVTSSDYRFAWMRILLPDHGADYSKLIRLIEGAEEFYNRRKALLKSYPTAPSNENAASRAQRLWDETESDFLASVAIACPDPKTLRVTLVKPTPYFLSLTSFPPFFPLHERSMRSFQSVDARTGQLSTSPQWCKPPNLISNGPFQLTQWRFKRDMRFERNPHYWNIADIGISSVSMPTIDDGNAAVLAFHTGGVDWVSDVVPTYRTEMLARKQQFYSEHQQEYEQLVRKGLDPIEIDRALPRDPRSTIHAFPAFGTYFYNFNCRKNLADGRPNPFSDARVRRAFAMCIDRKGVVDSVRRCGEPQAQTLIPPNSIHGYASPHGLDFNPDAARALLQEAGYSDPSQLGVIELLFNKDGGHDLIAQYIAKAWREHLGVSILLAQKEVKVFREQVKSGNFMISRGTWFGDYGDPTTFLDINRDGDGNNDRGYSSPEFESLMNEASDTADAAARMNILNRAEQIITERDLPLAPIFHFVQVYLFDAHEIRGITPHPRQEQLLFLVERLGGERDLPSSRVLRP
jgi:oligopeptide transport system substrate-binding protein